MWPNGWAGESVGTFQACVGVRRVLNTEDEGIGDGGGSEPVN